MAKALFEHPEDFQFPLVSGLLRPSYRVLNQIFCHNLYPKGNGIRPQEKAGITLWALGDPDTVCDWALFIFLEMAGVRSAAKSSKLPFPCLLTRILLEEHDLGDEYHVMHELSPSPIDSSFCNRSMGRIWGPRHLVVEGRDKKSLSKRHARKSSVKEEANDSEMEECSIKFLVDRFSYVFHKDY